jgi:hypothetical protein
MQMTAEINPAIAAWNAARAAVEAAPAGQVDQAITTLMWLENAIAATPVTSMENATLHLKIALAMAERQGEEDEPAWAMVASALAFLQRAA